MKLSLAILLLFTSSAHAGSLYQCKDENGRPSFQDRPCKGETVKVSEAKSDFNSGFRDEMIKALAKMTGKSESQLSDPKIRKAAEALAATDAAKSYAFTKIYGVSAKYCGQSVKSSLSNYQSEAADIIALGKYYYSNGIHIDLDGKKISHSGRELTEGLEGMLSKLDKEHSSANDKELKRKCRSASQSLNSLAKVYGS